MPLLRVADALKMPLQAECEGSIKVVVHSEDGHSFGLVVDEILDIVDQRVTITERADAHLMGSAVIQQHVTDLLDVPKLVLSMVGEGRIA
jgi:two-component system chemotaxis sensor kinase CheA